MALFIAYQAGQQSIRVEWDAVKAMQDKEVNTVNIVQTVETAKVITEYIDRVKTVRLKGETIIKQVPFYVTKEDDDRCIINDGFVVLWNAANHNEIPRPPGGTYDSSDTSIDKGITRTP